MASVRVILCRVMTQRSVTAHLNNSTSTKCTMGQPALRCRSFHNGPPEPVQHERPRKPDVQNRMLVGGLVSLGLGCLFAWYVDLFKPKLVEYDWDEIRRQRNEEKDEEDDDDDDDEEEEEEEEGAEEKEEAAEEEEESEEIEAEQVDEEVEVAEEAIEEEDVSGAGLIVEDIPEAVQTVIEEGEEEAEEIEAEQVIAEVEVAEETVAEEDVSGAETFVEAATEVVEHIAPIVKDYLAEKAEEIATGVGEGLTVLFETAPPEVAGEVTELIAQTLIVEQVAEKIEQVEEIAMEFVLEPVAEVAAEVVEHIAPIVKQVAEKHMEEIATEVGEMIPEMKPETEVVVEVGSIERWVGERLTILHEAVPPETVIFETAPSEVAVEVVEHIAPIVEQVAEKVEEIATKVGDMIPILKPETEVVVEVAEFVEEVAEVAEHIADIEEKVEEIAEKVEEIAEAILGESPVVEVEEAAVVEEAVVEEAVVEEAVVEEAVVEEAVVEEAVVEEAVVEEVEAVAEVEQAAVEQAVVEEAVVEVAVVEKAAVSEIEVVAGIPESVQYVLIGAGTASVSAMRAILKIEPNAQILMIGEEDYRPYMRPPLSKELWFTEEESAAKLNFTDWEGTERSVFYPDNLVPVSQLGPGIPALLSNTRVTKLDPTNQIVTIQDGTEIKYNKCLLAPGGQPRNLPALTPSPSSPCLHDKVHLFRNIAQYKQLSNDLGPDKKVLVVGGGFLGSELAYAMTQTGSEVYQSYPEAGNMGKVLPRYLSDWTAQQLEKAKIQLRTETTVTNSTCNEDNSVDVTLSTGEVLTVDHVVIAVGLEPSTELGNTAGLEVNEQMGGYVVNAELEARSNLFVAGDAACFYDPVLGRRRVEHHDHAVVSGKLAGTNMAGGKQPYHHQSMFWSDLGPSIGYEAIGLVDSLLPTVAIWAHRDKNTEGQISSNPSEPEEFEQGIVFYMQNDKIVGVVTWNIFGKMGIARKVIGEAAERTDFGKLAKQFNIHAKAPES